MSGAMAVASKNRQAGYAASPELQPGLGLRRNDSVTEKTYSATAMVGSYCTVATEEVYCAKARE